MSDFMIWLYLHYIKPYLDSVQRATITSTWI